VQSSTVVTRTDAGSAELAVPAHGLSLTQRRFLTLLDTSCTVDELALRHRAEAAKVERDLTRLVDLGLVVCAAPAPANDAQVAPPAAVRLGVSVRSRRLPLALVLASAIALAIAGWHPWAIPDVATGDRLDRNVPRKTPKAVEEVPASPDPQPIATRVLKGDPLDRSRDGARLELRAAAKSGEARADKPAARFALPVEHRSPSDDAAAGEVRIRMPTDAPPTAAPIATEPPATLSPMPMAEPAKPGGDDATTPPNKQNPPATPSPPAAASPIAPASARNTTAPTLAAPGTVDALHASAVTPADAQPLLVARAVPAVEVLAAPTPSPLVPVSRESPAFPREAIALGLAHGEVKAQVTIDANGSVTDVALLGASHRAFDRAVREALLRWRFPAGAAGRTTTIDVSFIRD
jgi:TonB family protein